VEKDFTQEWRDYQSGLDYNNRLDYYSKVDLNWSFYNSDQWRGITVGGLPKWTFNIVRSAINYFIAFMTSQKIKMQYSAENIPDEPQEEAEMQIKQVVDLLSDMADMKWEKDKMDTLLKDLLLDGANSGDMAVHVYWDDTIETGQDEKGDFKNELVDGGNVMLGNPNSKIIEKQPYILIQNREMVKDLKEEAKRNKIPQDKIDLIVADEENNYQAGDKGKIELDNKGENGKTLALIKYWKKDKETYWNKSTKYCPIFKDKKLGREKGEFTEETKFTCYPVAWNNWESIKNSYHGMSAAEGMIDNQISINQLFAMVSYWMKMSAFGKTIYDQNYISSWSNQLGVAIKADSNGGPIGNLVYQMRAGDFNSAILTVIDMAIKYTKDFIGANDTLMGQVNPEQASGAAIISTAKQASMPLVNISMNRDQLVEDLGLIWGEFFLKKYNSRKVSVKQKGKVVVTDYNAEAIKDVLLQCKVDVGPSTYWSEVVGIQALDRLLEQGQITKLQYFERVAKMNIIPDCQGLIEDAQKEMEIMAQQQQQQAQMQEQGQIEQQAQGEQQAQEQQQAKEAQFEQMANWLESQPEEVQRKIMMLPSDQKEEMIVKMMREDAQNAMKQQQPQGTM